MQRPRIETGVVHAWCLPRGQPRYLRLGVTVEDGRAVKLAGDRAYPFTRAALCVKLNRCLEHTRAPHRCYTH